MTAFGLTPSARAKLRATLVQVDLATPMSGPDANGRKKLLRQAGCLVSRSPVRPRVDLIDPLSIQAVPAVFEGPCFEVLTTQIVWGKPRQRIAVLTTAGDRDEQQYERSEGGGKFHSLTINPWRCVANA
jgi:hypothetical protein